MASQKNRISRADTFKVYQVLQTLDVPTLSMAQLRQVIQEKTGLAVVDNVLRSVMEDAGIEPPRLRRMGTGRSDRLVQLARVVRDLFGELGQPVPQVLTDLCGKKVTAEVAPVPVNSVPDPKTLRVVPLAKS